MAGLLRALHSGMASTTKREQVKQIDDRCLDYAVEIRWLQENEVEPYRSAAIAALRGEIAALRREMARITKEVA